MLRSSSRLRNSTSSSSLASNSSTCSSLSTLSSTTTLTTLSNSSSTSFSSSTATSSKAFSKEKKKHQRSSSDSSSFLTLSPSSSRKKRKSDPLSSHPPTFSPPSTRSKKSTLSTSTSTTVEPLNINSTALHTTLDFPHSLSKDATSSQPLVPKKTFSRHTRTSAKAANPSLSSSVSSSFNGNDHGNSNSSTSTISSLDPSSSFDLKGKDPSFITDQAFSNDSSSSHPWKVGDYVFLRSETKGEPYYLGRIMSFVDNHRAKIAWFYRPQDVLSKKINYPNRLVVASMHSDINPLRSIVEKCTIRHLSEIQTEMQEYLSQPNTFYYHQLFDRFTKKVYDVIPSSNLTNRPPMVCKLIQQFPFFLIEEGKDKELKQLYKECQRCHQYVPKEDSLECLTCASVYHSGCLSIVKKPKVGYRWQCHFCTVGLPPPTDPSLPELDPSSSMTLGDLCTENSQTSLNGSEFPFTYFGIHCSNLDAFELDVQHPFYPRLASRISSKYQAVVPPYIEPSSSFSSPHTDSMPKSKRFLSLNSTPFTKNKRRTSTSLSHSYTSVSTPFSSSHSLSSSSLFQNSIMVPSVNTGLPSRISVDEYLSSIPDRSLDPPLISSIPSSAQHEVEQLMDMLKNSKSLALPAYSTTLLDRAIYEFQRSGHNAKATLEILTSLSVQNFTHGTYPSSLSSSISSSERALHSTADPNIDVSTLSQFIKAVEEYGFDLNLIHKHALPHVCMPTLVLTLYLHKKSEPILNALKVFFQAHETHFELDISWLTKLPPNPITLARNQLLSSVTPSSSSPSAVSPSISSNPLISSQSEQAISKGTKSLPMERMEDEDDEVSVSEHELVEANECSYCKRTSSRYILSNLALSTLQPQPISPTSSTPVATTISDSKLDLPTLSLSATVSGIDTLSNAAPSTCFIFCQDCGQYWLKYGGFPPLSTAPQGREPREMLSEKRKEEDTETIPMEDDVLSDCSSLASPPFRPQRMKRKRPLPACELCLQMEDLISCVDCGIHVHPSCYGIALIPRKWRCAVCLNQKHPTCSMEPHCLLCPSSVQDTWILTKKQLPLKPTLHFNWVHLLCALFLPMLGFKQWNKLEGVFGIETIPSSMYSRPCSLCMQSQGVTVQCHHSGCSKLFHISCAFRYGCVFGLEPSPSSSANSKEGGPTSNSKLPVLWCRPHGLQATQAIEPIFNPAFDFFAFTEPPVISKALIDQVIQTHAHLKPPFSGPREEKMKVCVVKTNNSVKDLKIKFKLQCFLPKLPLHTAYSCTHCGSDISLYWFALHEKVGQLTNWDYLAFLHAQQEAEAQYHASTTFVADQKVKLCSGPRKCMMCFATGK